MDVETRILERTLSPTAITQDLDIVEGDRDGSTSEAIVTHIDPKQHVKNGMNENGMHENGMHENGMDEIMMEDEVEETMSVREFVPS